MNEIILKHPYTVAGKTIEKLTFRRATVKDLRLMHRAGSNDEEKEIWLIATLSALVPEDLDPMDAADYKSLQGSLVEILTQ